MQTLQAGKVLQEIVRYGFAPTNLPPLSQAASAGCSVVGGSLVDECDGLGTLLIRRQP
jgi:hypothetical protein